MQASGSLAASRANRARQDLSKLPSRGSQVLRVGGYGKVLKTASPLKKTHVQIRQIMLAGHNQFKHPSKHKAIH
jgi:hypothetical protein